MKEAKKQLNDAIQGILIAEMKQIRPALSTDSNLSPVQKLLWGAFWGFAIGGAWYIADLVRPLIYGGL